MMIEKRQGFASLREMVETREKEMLNNNNNPINNGITHWEEEKHELERRFTHGPKIEQADILHAKRFFSDTCLEKIGEKVRVSREKMGLTQLALTRFLNVDKNKISYIEAGRWKALTPVIL